MSNSRYCIIMAGGIGTRFWPESRQAKPKQFLDILESGKSFIRSTYERFLPMVASENFLIVTNSRYKELVLEHIPELNEKQILCEPIGRNTAPCIAYAAYSIAAKDPNAQMIVTPADHYITSENLFRESISEALDFISTNNALMTIGIKPTRPETGYGYIQLSSATESLCKVKCFTEKPNIKLAETFLQCGEFVWNSGIFIWSVKSIIESLRIHLPDIHALFGSISSLYGTAQEEEAVRRAYSDSKSISIDYGVMEKAENVFVKIGEFGWSDIGTWGSLFDHAYLDDNGNLSPMESSYLYNTKDSVISAPKGKAVVVSGLSEYIVVDTDDVLMICPRNEEQNIKNFIEDIKYRGGEEYL